jgi:hypothetical protein
MRCHWRERLLNDDSLRPGAGYGQTNRLLTDEEEHELAESGCTDYIPPRQYCPQSSSRGLDGEFVAVDVVQRKRMSRQILATTQEKRLAGQVRDSSLTSDESISSVSIRFP